MMKKKYWFLVILILFYLMPAYGLPIENIYNKLKKHVIKITQVKGAFGEVFAENSKTNMREFIFTPAFSGLKFFTIDNGKYSFDCIEINEQKFLLITYDYLMKGETFLLHSHPGWSTVYKFDDENKKYLCITLEESGSGSGQEIKNYVVFDITDINHIKYSCINSRFSGIDAFGDYNGDGVLDFAFFDYYHDYKNLKKYNPESSYYLMSFFTFADGGFRPLNNLTKRIIERDKDYNFCIIADR